MPVKKCGRTLAQIQHLTEARSRSVSTNSGLPATPENEAGMFTDLQMSFRMQTDC